MKKKVMSLNDALNEAAKRMAATLRGEESKPIDMVNHPPHYTAGGIETIDFMRAKLSPHGFRGYLAGNVIKYITRYEHKNGREDLEKAQWYLTKLIAEVGTDDNTQ